MEWQISSLGDLRRLAPTCLHMQAATTSLILHLRKHQAWPVSSLPSTLGACVNIFIQILDVQVRGLGSTDYKREKASCQPWNGNLQRLREAAETAREQCTGYCLDCVHNLEEATDGSCRLKHKKGLMTW